MKKTKLRGVKMLKIVFVIAIVFVLGVFLFLKLWKPFGAKPSDELLLEYDKQADNFYEGSFHPLKDARTITREKSEYSGENRIAENGIPVQHLSEIPRAKNGELKWCWFGHSSSLLQMGEINILIDPVMSDFSSPVQLPIAVPKRMSEFPIAAEDFPEVDVLVISHDHYDHLDYNTILTLDDKIKKYLVPIGVDQHLIRWGVDANKIETGVWWDTISIDGIDITLTPGQHYTGRLPWWNSTSLWSGFVFENGDHRVYYTGDTGFGEHFKMVQERFEEMDLLIVENGQYDKQWAGIHMFPEESVEVCKIVNAKWSVPVHWGTFCICRHPWDDSIKRFTKAAKEENVSYATPRIGEIVDYDSIEQYNETWWEEVE